MDHNMTMDVELNRIELEFMHFMYNFKVSLYTKLKILVLNLTTIK